jgi:hypothetical protein
VVQHEIVAVGVGEERHAANACVERLAGEGDALALQLGPGLRDVIDMQREMPILLGRELDPEPPGLPDAKTRVACPELELRVVIRTESESFAVEPPRTL